MTRDRANELAEEAVGLIQQPRDDADWVAHGCPSDATLIAAVIRKAMAEQRVIDRSVCNSFASAVLDERVDDGGDAAPVTWDKYSLGRFHAATSCADQIITAETPPPRDPSKESHG